MPTPFPTLQVGDAAYNVGPAVGMRDGYAIVVIENYDTGDFEAVLVKERGTSLEEADRIVLPTPAGEVYYRVWDIVRCDATYAAVLCDKSFGSGTWALVLQRAGDTLSAGTPLVLDSVTREYQNLVAVTSADLIWSRDNATTASVDFTALTRSGTTLATSGSSSSFSRGTENVVPAGIRKIADDAEVYSYYHWTTGPGRFSARIVDLGDPPTVGSEFDIYGSDVDGVPGAYVGLIGKAGTQVADQVAVVGLNYDTGSGIQSLLGRITRTGPATGSATFSIGSSGDGGGTWDIPWPQGVDPFNFVADDGYFFLVNGQFLSYPGFDRVAISRTDLSTGNTTTLQIDPPVSFDFTPSGVLTEGASAFVFWADTNDDLWVGLLAPAPTEVPPLRLKQRDDPLQWHGGIRIPLGNRPTSRQRGIRIPGPNTYT